MKSKKWKIQQMMKIRTLDTNELNTINKPASVAMLAFFFASFEKRADLIRLRTVRLNMGNEIGEIDECYGAWIGLHEKGEENYQDYWNEKIMHTEKNVWISKREALNQSLEQYSEMVHCNSLNHDLNRSVVWITDYLKKHGFAEVEALKIGLVLADQSLQALKAKTDRIIYEEEVLEINNQVDLQYEFMKIAELII